MELVATSLAIKNCSRTGKPDQATFPASKPIWEKQQNHQVAQEVLYVDF